MQQIFRAMVLHGGSPVSERVNVDLRQSWVLKSVCCSSPSACEPHRDLRVPNADKGLPALAK